MEDEVAQITREHARRVMTNFRRLRERQMLLDFTICVGDKKLMAHKVLLAAGSDYFKAMFSHASKESSKGEVILHDIDPDAVEAIIDYIYSGKISLNDDNIESILLAASILQIRSMQDICTIYIENKIDTSNCLGVVSLTERCNLMELNCKALDYCFYNFKQIINEAEFLDIDDNMLAKLISSDKLNVDDETEVFQAVLLWIRAREEQRMPRLHRVIEHVRFGTLDPVTLVSLSKHDLIRASPECQEFIEKAKNYLLLKNFPKLHQEHAKGLVTRPRHSRRRIYAVGGVGLNSSGRYQSMAMAEVYDPKTDVWTEIQPMSENRCSVGVAALNHSIYAVGGHDGSVHLRSVERFDIAESTWKQDVAPMFFERSSVAVVALNNFIYAIGGQAPAIPTNNGLALDKVERYNLKTNTWETCQSMKSPRLGAGVAVLNGRIYVMGGSNHNRLYEVHGTVEIYDPETDTWTWGPSMLIPRKHFGCCSCSGLIYAVGGRNSYDGQLDSSEVLNPTSNIWSEIPKMSRKRAGLGLVELDGLIYAIGGQNHDEKLNLVEVYDPATKTWQKKASMLNCRLGAGITVYPS